MHILSLRTNQWGWWLLIRNISHCYLITLKTYSPKTHDFSNMNPSYCPLSVWGFGYGITISWIIMILSNPWSICWRILSIITTSKVLIYTFSVVWRMRHLLSRDCTWSVLVVAWSLMAGFKMVLWRVGFRNARNRYRQW